MYISKKECIKLDEILKGFEVAYRSYVCEKMIKSNKNVEEFKQKISDVYTKYNATSVINSGLFKSKIANLKNKAEEIYNTFIYTNQCIYNKDFSNADVLYASQIIDLVIVFFSTDFHKLANNFDSTNEFLYLSNSYLQCRNNLAHPASSKINRKESVDTLLYISKLMKVLDKTDFWYMSEEEILSKIIEFNKLNSDEIFLISNINEINIDYKKLIQREEEVNQLWELIVGRNSYYRKSGSVVVYGYGGIGKTSVILEFINELRKNKLDETLDANIDFLLFFSSKDERLDFSYENGDYYINQMKKQVQFFDDLKEKIYKYLDVKIDEEFYNYNKCGIIVIDNFETFSRIDKEKIMKFIRMSPRNIQYIISSRNEERCEDKIYIDGFTENNNGTEFVKSYIKENNLDIELNSYQIKELLEGSKGNTLILVLSLMRLSKGRVKFETIIDELSSVASQNSAIIAEFMYKNTFDIAIKELEEKGYNPKQILTIISLYDEDIDLLTISLLSEIKLKEVEEVCKFLTEKLILNKNDELYTINEFANKFVFIKFMPILEEILKIQHKITETKIRIKKSISNLERSREKNKLLSEIMNDWKPKTTTDKIAIAEVFQYYGEAHGIVNNIKKRTFSETLNKIKELDKKFKKYELNTSHPYVRYQKARVFHLLLINNIEYDNIKDIVKDYYEKTILSVEFEYTYISNTNSFANVLWIYGTFLGKYFDEYEIALNHLEKSKRIFMKINNYTSNYYKCLAEGIKVIDTLLINEYNEEYKCIRDENLNIIKNNLNIDCNKKFIRWYDNQSNKRKNNTCILIK